MKYGNKKTEVDGITFDSRKEAQRYVELKMLERARIISELELQKEFELIPTQKVDGRVVERACKYKADFFYYDHEKQSYVVEDTKGFKTKEYIIKRKLMLYRYGIRITEI